MNDANSTNETVFLQEDRFVNNYITHSQAIIRIGEILEDINSRRLSNGEKPLIHTDPGNSYCHITTNDGSEILWVVNLKTGNIIGLTVGNLPDDLSAGWALHWHYNIWHESPTDYFTESGYANSLAGVPYYTNGKANEFKSSGTIMPPKAKRIYENSLHPHCIKSDTLYNRYALEA